MAETTDLLAKLGYLRRALEDTDRWIDGERKHLRVAEEYAEALREELRALNDEVDRATR